MRNPFFKAPPVDALEGYEHADAYRALENYLRVSAPVEEIEDRKLRSVHSDLEDDAIWNDVRAKLEESAGVEANEPPAAPARPRGATKRAR